MSFKDLVLAGGKGGGGSSFKNRPDNLRSTDSFEALIGLTSNRASLAPGGLRNLFVNDIPVEDDQGKSSLEDFTAVVFDGDPTQLAPIKLTLGSSAGPSNLNLTLTNPGSDSIPGPWVNGVVTQQGVDFIDIRLVVQSLYRQDKKGVYDADANIEIELRPSGTSTWINPLLGSSAPAYNPDGYSPFKEAMQIVAQRQRWNEAGTGWADTGSTLRISGKTTSPYVKEIRIAVPNTGAYANRTWEARCRLLERDYYVGGEDNLDEEHRVVVWESIAGVSQDPIGGSEAWRGLSYVQIFGKASDQINGVPEIKGVYDIGRFLVPPQTVFNPSDQSYTGAAWDGVTTQIAWTRCPAWQIKGLVEDDLSGVSALVPGSTLNKWDALEASKWFAERVPDGRGGTQPRYTLNWISEQPMQVGELVSYLSGAVGAFSWDEGDGRWRMKVEKPETPQMIFTTENIVGEFIYSHTDWDSRFNDFTGVYRDRDNRYQENRVRTFDQPSIDQTGRKATTIVLVGCDNRQEALRRLELRKLTSLKETRIVTFMTNRQGALLEPFAVIGVADGDLNSSTAIRSTGRIIALSGDRTMLTVRDALRLEVGVAYQIHITIPNPDYAPETSAQPDNPNWRKPTITITRNVTNTAAQRGDIYQLSLDAPLPASVPEYATIALSAVGLPALPKQYRVLAVVPDDNGENVSITASEIYTAKWVESDNVSEDAILAQQPSRNVPAPVAPAGGVFQIRQFKSAYQWRRILVASWQRPAHAWLEGFRVEHSVNGAPWQLIHATIKDTSIEMGDPIFGTHRLRICALDRRGAISEPLIASIDITEQLMSSYYPDGTPVQDLRPAEPGSDVTGGNVSAGIIGQGSGATANSLAQLNATDAANLQSVLDAIGNIANDNSISRNEKWTLIEVQRQYNTLLTAAVTASTAITASYGDDPTAAERTAATNAWNALMGYLTGLSPAWDNVAVDTPVVGTTLRGHFNAVAAATANLMAANSRVGLQRAQVDGRIYDQTTGNFLTRAGLITTLGISAGFTGQGWGATADQKALDNSYVQTVQIKPWGASVSGNSITRSSGNSDYAAAAYGDRINGPCFVSKVVVDNAWNMVSLDDNLSSSSYDSMTATVHYHPNASGGVISFYLDGVPIANPSSVGNWTGSELQLIYDGSFFRIMLGGAEAYSRAAPANLSLYPVWHAYNAGVRYWNLRSGPARSAARIGANTYDASGNLKNGADLVTVEGISAGFAGQGGLATRNDVGTAQIQVGAVSGDKLAMGAKGPNLIANPCGADLTTNGWALVEGGGGSFSLSPIQYFAEGRRGFMFWKGEFEAYVAYGVKAIPVTPGKRYVWRFTWGTDNAGYGGGAYHRINYSAIQPSNGFVDSGNRSGTHDFLASGPVPASGPHMVEYVWTCPSNVFWASPAIYNWVGSGIFYASDFEFLEQHSETNLAPNAVRLGGNVVQSNGTTPVTDATAITAQGISAGFTGQGPGATASAQDVLNYHEAGGVTTIRRPGGGVYAYNGGGVTGAIKIALPVANSHTMLRFYVDIYDYQAGATQTYLISGYPYSSSGTPSWTQVDAQFNGSSQFSKGVRFGWDGTTSCVWIGGTDSWWSYPQVTVRDFQAGYNGNLASSWNSGWVVSMDTVGATIVSQYVARPRAGDAIMGENVLEAPGTPATNANYKTNQGISAGFQGQGALATRNSITLGDGFTHGFGSFAALSQINAGNITNYIANQAIGSAVIANASIGTAHIDQIAVSKIVAGSLDALSSTIGLLRTRTTGARLELESNEIRAYHANGNLAFRLSGGA